MYILQTVHCYISVITTDMALKQQWLTFGYLANSGLVDKTLKTFTVHINISLVRLDFSTYLSEKEVDRCRYIFSSSKDNSPVVIYYTCALCWKPIYAVTLKQTHTFI